MNSNFFNELSISNDIKRALERMGFSDATPIQEQAIPPLLNGEDIIAQAPTGTGKTCAFGIPAVELVDRNEEFIQAVVLCPTRELAIQITHELNQVSAFSERLKVVAVYGGQPIERQILALKRKPQIVVATPGRLMDHMRRKTVKLDKLKMIILDEADEMLNMGFREDIDTILETVPEERQTALFSATISPEIKEIARLYQKPDVNFIKTTTKEITVSNVEQYYLEAKGRKKTDVLMRLLDTGDYRLSLVFCNTKKSVDELYETLISKGYQAEALHGDMKQVQRDRVMKRFKCGVANILIATDIAARGLDIDNVDAVFNYDIPNEYEYYVHRIGRTGRANNTGVSYTFASNKEMFKLKEIMKFTKSNILPFRSPSEEDVVNIKTKKLVEALKNNISEELTEKYRNYIYDIENAGISLTDFTAALIDAVINPLPVNDAVDEKKRMTFDTGAEKDMVRLFVSVGTLDKVRHRHLKEMVSVNTSMESHLIGAIDIYDKYSFMEVPVEYADEVISGISGTTFRGRKISIEKAQRKR